MLEKFEKELKELKDLLLTNKKVLNIVDLSNYTGISTSYLYKLTSENKIPYYKPNGKNLYFDKDEVDTWLLRNKIECENVIKQNTFNISQKSNHKNSKKW